MERARTPGALRLLAAAALIAAGAPARADPAPDAVHRPLAISLQIDAAVGGGSHYGRGSLSLGLGAAVFARSGLLLVGGTADGEVYLRGYGTTYLGVLAGVARDVGRVRLELVAEAGAHRIEGIGNDSLEAKAISPATARLPYAGARAGFLGGFPLGGARLVGGVWLAYRADLARRDVDVTLEDAAGAARVERITAGGQGFAILARAGFEL